jgi:hypothetical protein
MTAIMVTVDPIPIDHEWATSLLGLRMKVQESWWPGYHGTNLCPGMIVDVDFSCQLSKFFFLQLDGEDWTYAMCYHIVLLYANEEDPNYHNYHLPDGLLLDMDGKEVTIVFL